MMGFNPFTSLPTVVKQKPLQSGKFVGILLSLVLAIAGFFRIINAKTIAEGPTLGDGQFLALVLLPLVSLCLVFLVFIETVVSGFRVLRSEHSLSDQIGGSPGYVLLRGAEAAVAVLGVTLLIMAVPPLLAESTPAPAGVGIMLLLFGVGLGILLTSFIRSSAELFVFS